MAKKNVASGNDVVAVQVGTVRGRSRPAGSEEPKTTPSRDTSVTNVRSGNAKVGVQADEIDTITIMFGRRR